MGNVELAQSLIDRVVALGVADVCVCAGSRNSPLLVALGARDDVRLYSFIDERAAAFFALGRIKLTGRPVAVVTTSGTAVAELLPATIEAFYSGLPLILITADRPARFRGTAAPQCIDQEGIFGVFASAEFSPARPTHINIEFDEPLLEASAATFSSSEWSADTSLPHEEDGGTDKTVRAPQSTFRRPLLILSGLAPRHHARVRTFALQLGAPIYAEPLSGLREDDALRPLILTAGERILGHTDFDGVIRIGNVPTLRYWRDLEESRRALPVVHFSDLPFAGLTRGEVHPIETLFDPRQVDRDEALFALDRDMAARFAAILDEEPHSELAMIRALSRYVAANARVYIGNSLPIREWDLAATREARGFTIEANRGANGIDGQLSTFFGQCDPARANVCVVGDLTAIYDMNAPWIAPQLDPCDFRIVVVNNGGGRIFSRVGALRRVDTALRERIIENVHAFRFEPWAKMWGLDDHVTELLPDEDASRRVWQRYDELWA